MNRERQHEQLHEQRHEQREQQHEHEQQHGGSSISGAAWAAARTPGSDLASKATEGFGSGTTCPDDDSAAW